MRKFIFLLTTVCAFTLTFAASKVEVKPPLLASQVLLPIGNSGQRISLEELSRIKIKDFEALSGKKMKFFDKIGFKIAQKQLRNSINYDGTFNKKKLKKLFSKSDGESGFHLGGFALGLLLGLIGVLIAYIINDDKKANRRKWAWIGWAIWVVIVVLTLI